MNDISHVSIIGLGLIGGSLAKALRRAHPNLNIVGMDVNCAYVKAALNESVINKTSDSLEEAAQNSQVIFLCTPVTSILESLEILASCAADGAIVTDTGSTKLEIMEKAQRTIPSGIHFIGGHPMTGTERSGFSSSMPHLFENAYYVLTPASATPPETIEMLKSLVSSTGAIPIVMDADTHDNIVGSISHLPHVLASALVNTVSGIQDPEQYRLKLAAGGFKDITRIASSNPRMWSDISLSNKGHLAALIDSMIEELNSFKYSLEKSASDRIESFFRNAKEFRDKLKPSHTQTISAYSELYVDIEDRPGIIGKITTLLGESGINIKNLRIIHSREDEPEGCLVISFARPESVIKSKSILTANGYKSFER